MFATRVFVVALASSACAPSCFTAGTRIRTPRGPKPIEDLAVGDVVYAFDCERRELVEERIEALLRSEGARLATVVVGTHRIEGVTPEHPFFDPERGTWLDASELSVGQAVVVFGDGAPVPSKVTAVEWRAGPVAVFNITVSGQHNYFAEDVLVHNKLSVQLVLNGYESISIEAIGGWQNGELDRSVWPGSGHATLSETCAFEVDWVADELRAPPEAGCDEPSGDAVASTFVRRVSVEQSAPLFPELQELQGWDAIEPFALEISSDEWPGYAMARSFDGEDPAAGDYLTREAFAASEEPMIVELTLLPRTEDDFEGNLSD